MLHEKEQALLDAIKESLRQRGRLPTEKEVVCAAGIARGSLRRTLLRLADKGYLREVRPLGMLRFDLICEGNTNAQ